MLNDNFEPFPHTIIPVDSSTKRRTDFPGRAVVAYTPEVYKGAVGGGDHPVQVVHAGVGHLSVQGHSLHHVLQVGTRPRQVPALRVL